MHANKLIDIKVDYGYFNLELKGFMKKEGLMI